MSSHLYKVKLAPLYNTSMVVNGCAADIESVGVSGIPAFIIYMYSKEYVI